MKRIFAFVFIFVSFFIYAQDQNITITEFDQVLLQKGTLIMKEFIPFSAFNTIIGEIAILTNANTGIKYYALRLSTSYYKSQYDNGKAIGTLDAKEILSAINSLDYMIKRNLEITSQAPYTEIIFRTNGEPEFGYYVSGSERKMYFKVSTKSTSYYNINQLEVLKKFFEEAKQKIIDLGGRIE